MFEFKFGILTIDIHFWLKRPGKWSTVVVQSTQLVCNFVHHCTHLPNMVVWHTCSQHIW